jgi:glycosyltransferase involved in cell wall biosynthesis
VIEDGVTGFLVSNPVEAVDRLQRLPEIDRSACRERVERCFSVEAMVRSYERVYGMIFDLEPGRRA